MFCIHVLFSIYCMGISCCMVSQNNICVRNLSNGDFKQAFIWKVLWCFQTVLSTWKKNTYWKRFQYYNQNNSIGPTVISKIKFHYQFGFRPLELIVFWDPALSRVAESRPALSHPRITRARPIRTQGLFAPDPEQICTRNLHIAYYIEFGAEIIMDLAINFIVTASHRYLIGGFW